MTTIKFPPSKLNDIVSSTTLPSKNSSSDAIVTKLIMGGCLIVSLLIYLIFKTVKREIWASGDTRTMIGLQAPIEDLHIKAVNQSLLHIINILIQHSNLSMMATDSMYPDIA